MESNEPNSGHSFHADCSAEFNEINLREDIFNNTDLNIHSRNMSGGFAIFQIGRNNNVNIAVNKNLIQSQENQVNQYNESSENSSIRRKQLLVPSGKVSVEDLLRISKQIGSKWKDLGRQLKLEDSQLEIINADYFNNGGLMEISYQMLIQWREKYAEAATYRVLVNALLTVKLKNLAKSFELPAIS